MLGVEVLVSPLTLPADEGGLGGSENGGRPEGGPLSALSGVEAMADVAWMWTAW